ncbi:MAG: M56 family metallopeptidase [Lachnospiraceae bacterium]|nr:M56 family metallopeptidase [Lachnospiraceae bacterium]MDE6186067.1 M56 family metallopeptidase [Lachnospiraceae bacterium]
MKEIFMCVLSLSLSGALAGALILLIRPFTERVCSKRWNYYIWLLVAARLMFPVYVHTEFSEFLTLETVRQQESVTGMEAAEVPEGLPAEGIEGVKAPESIAEAPWSGSLQEDRMQGGLPIVDLGLAVAVIWFLGVIVSLLLKSIDYWQFTSGIRKRCELTSDYRVHEAVEGLCAGLHIRRKPLVCECKSIQGPITIGLWRTIIVLPEEKGDLEQLPMILHHELIHVKRKDLWYKWLYQILLCVHWFNPVLYLIVRKMNMDCELACDEAVLGRLTQEGKKAYGNILLDTAQRNIGAGRKIPSLTLLERKEDLKERLKGIVSYRKKTGAKVLASLCLMGCLLVLTACAGVQISSNERDDWEEKGYFWDRLAAWVDVGLEDFMGATIRTDKDGDAWKSYDDDGMIAGDDVRDQWRMYVYVGGKRLRCDGMFLNGTATVMIVNAHTDKDIEVNSTFEVEEGRFKVVYVDPDGNATVINENGEKTSVPITLKEGRNVIKLVGQEAKIKYLRMSYSGLRENAFESIYYSAEEEKSAIIKEQIQAGYVNKDEVMEYLYYLDDGDISKALILLLKKGEVLSSDEFCDMIIYSNSELSGRYLVEAISKGEIEPLSEKDISEIKYYLEEESLRALLDMMKENLTFDLLYDCAPYLSSDSLEKIVRNYEDAGGEFTELQWHNISPYLDDDAIESLRPLKPLKPLKPI